MKFNYAVGNKYLTRFGDTITITEVSIPTAGGQVLAKASNNMYYTNVVGGNQVWDWDQRDNADIVKEIYIAKSLPATAV